MRWLALLLLVLPGCAGQTTEFDGALNDEAQAYVFDPLVCFEATLSDVILDVNDGSGF